MMTVYVRLLKTESCQLRLTALCACRFADAPKQVIIR